ncbi:MAG: polyprenyl synthetase family protein [Pseudomonadota bacterium]
MSFEQRVNTLTDRVEQTLDGWLPDPKLQPQPLHESMRYAVFNGGKRIRPLLSYATAELLALSPERVDPIAAAIELIHCYSLVHDDLPAMDNDDLRRGKPTVHCAFDEATAILCGDALQALAFERLAKSSGNIELVVHLARACSANGMAGGQALDLMFETKRPEQDQIEHMFQLKTGALLSASVVMPLMLDTGANHALLQPLQTFSEAIGLAFQIIDDLLDVEGTSEQIGKPAGSDQAMQKASWPILFGVKAAHQRAEGLIETAAAQLEQLPGDTEPLRWMAQRILKRNF